MLATELLTADEKQITMHHAIEIALHSSHRARAKAWAECATPADFDESDALNAHGKQRKALWFATYDLLVSQAEYAGGPV